ncbi:phosphatidic acid phosphatase [Subtercola boreus]|uniref:Phosphatidic acid phosphatase n=1 Tax=Subtercola boreus TaxID=120213 RepID=A0A3E0VAL5_9MICO|nr:phosphatase PAP2 family protein [Subtercola boreus]RFA06518.1 phosphatidic acid phosphatase [Subtercola boreus]TQL46815.1 undecaprenyl-diphosphatase [Subtercola boreus]
MTHFRAFLARLSPTATLVVILTVGLLIAVLLSAAVAQVYDSITDTDGVSGLDQPILDWVITLRSPGLDAAVTAYTNVAGPIGMPIIAVVALVALGLRWRSWTPVILIVAAGGGSLLLTVSGKDLIGRVRPPLNEAVPPYEYSPSFPSGHTLNAVVVAGTIAYLLVLHQTSTLARTLTIGIATVFAVTIGLSRVFLGHHWFTDVLAGFILGLAWLAIIITAHRLMHILRARRRTLRRPADLTPESSIL